MTNEAISQMPAAAALTGAELIELVQSGVNVQSTVAAIAPSSTTSSVFGNASATFGAGFGSLVRWTLATFSPYNAGVQGGVASDSSTGVQWNTGGGTWAVSHPNPGAASIYAAAGFPVLTSSSGSNNLAADLNGSGTWGTNAPQQMYRLLSPALPIGGLTMTWYGGLDALATAGGTCFFGVAATNGALAGTTVPSALLNCIGFSKDPGDNDIQFIYNNGGGTATKTDTGIAASALIHHMLKVVITCDVLGNVVATLTDLESGGAGTVTYSIPTATAKLPAANTTVQPHFWASTGTQTAAVGFMFHSVFTTASFL